MSNFIDVILKAKLEGDDAYAQAVKHIKKVESAAGTSAGGFKRMQSAAKSAMAGIRAGAAATGSALRKMATAPLAIGRGLKTAMAAVGLLGAAAVAASKKAVSAYNTQAAAEAKLAAVIKATGGASGLTSRELIKQAESLSTVTGVADETIISMQGILASFKEIKGDQFNEATMAVLDMSAALGKAGKGSADIETAVIQVGKALNDPIKGMTALRRVGVSFTKQQEDQVKAMQEAGNVAGAQALILAELQSEFGGTAEAMSKAKRGTDQLSNAWGDAVEEVGRVITETSAFDGVISRVTNALKSLKEDGYIELWAQNVRKAIDFIMPAVTAVAKAFGFVKSAIETASAFAGALSAGSSVKEASEIAFRTGDELRAEQESKRQEILAQRAAKEKEAVAEERAELEAAKVKQQAQPEQTDSEKAKAEKEKAKLVKDEDALKKQLAEAQRQQNEANDAALANENDQQIERLKKDLAAIPANREERKAKRLEERQERREKNRLEQLKNAQMRGVKLGPDALAALSRDQLKRDLATAEENKREAEKTARENAEKRAQEVREGTMKLLQDNLAQTRQLLQAAGG